MKHIYIFLLTSVLFYQCDITDHGQDGPGLGPIKKNFVLSYAALDSIAFKVVIDHVPVSNLNTINNIRLEVEFIPDEVFSHNDKSELNRNIFKKYARLYKDTSFNKTSSLGFHHTCMIDTISKIDVLCNRSYDDNHLSDVSLSDIIKIYYSCAAYYINNHYTSQYDSLKYIKNITLQEYNKEDNYLVAMAESFLSFLVPPKESGEYIFTIKVYLKNGRHFIYKLNPILLEGKI